MRAFFMVRKKETHHKGGFDCIFVKVRGEATPSPMPMKGFARRINAVIWAEGPKSHITSVYPACKAFLGIGYKSGSYPLWKGRQREERNIPQSASHNLKQCNQKRILFNKDYVFYEAFFVLQRVYNLIEEV